MRTVALVQARMGSTRLPGKVLMDIGGRTMLDRVVSRVERAALLDQTVVVTSFEPQDDVIATHCRDSGTDVFRGSEADVLDRYYMAAKARKADVIVRITADCPFTDPEVIDQVVGAFNSSGTDYASNTLVRSFPHGLDVEVFSLDALTRAAQVAREDFERAHVTPFIYQHPELFLLHQVVGQVDYSHYRITVDQIEDLELARALYERVEDRESFGWLEAVSILENDPELVQINRDVRQKKLLEG